MPVVGWTKIKLLLIFPEVKYRLNKQTVLTLNGVIGSLFWMNEVMEYKTTYMSSKFNSVIIYFL